MQTILITGGTGLIGSRLSQLLTEKKYNVIHLSRRQNLKATYPAYAWDLNNKTIDQEAIEKADAIIHLAGAGIADKRWTEKRKKIIEDSRVKGTELLVEKLNEYNHNVKVLVGGSAVGYYGDRGSELCMEDTELGEGFLSETCQKWEDSYNGLKELDIRNPLIRTGIVLSTKGGALQKMLPSYNVRVGTYFGSGEQYYSWIHIDDICNLFIYALENKQMNGIYNGSAPEPITNYELAKAIGDAMEKKVLLMPAPTFAMKFALGEMAAVVLDSTRAIPEATMNAGFAYQYPEPVKALKDIINHKK